MQHEVKEISANRVKWPLAVNGVAVDVEKSNQAHILTLTDGAQPFKNDFLIIEKEKIA